MFWMKIDDVNVSNVEFQEPGIPDLDCSGSISWVDVEPGATVTDEFTVSNIGEPASILNWEIESNPEWGTGWVFEPASGSIADGESINVSVTTHAPDDTETEFTGEIVIVNSDDSEDTCTIDISLATPVSVLSCAKATTYLSA